MTMLSQTIESRISNNKNFNLRKTMRSTMKMRKQRSIMGLLSMKRIKMIMKVISIRFSRIAKIISSKDLLEYQLSRKEGIKSLIR
jgi:hypothetical protein